MKFRIITNNPELRMRRSWKQAKYFSLFLVMLCLITGGAWFVLNSGYYRLANVEINDLTTLGKGEVVSTTYQILDRGGWRPWGNDNLVFIDTEKLSSSLKDELFAESVAVDKVYPNILRLMIEERQRSVVMSSQGQYLQIDTQGMVAGYAEGKAKEDVDARLADKSLADPKTPPLIICDLPELAAAGYQVTDSEFVKKWLEAYKALNDAGLKFRYFRLSSPSSDLLKVVTDGGYEVYYDLKTPLNGQIEVYKKFVASKPKDLKIHEYIDIRIPGKVYLK
ncbi:MAG: hypothetical protein RDU25_02885 [Patescibacteria group bacterium]|nr:hypothetical protein [Patescibacteria group bacterium]